ncbi:nucleolar protein 58-like [Arachis ipaensis]|uniref:DUF4283 domain-containing protein n=1 Tax=Arachis hypogaea TaxID=3818 RepID=A0A445A7A5_ARAHY|nr:nucleolar protein 58-like [Arachis ipaensis]XP_025637237.1 nucleolar protein 58-like [Arachis hypogaea]RYR22222.1 hypothetical protein Ahy_B03g067496 [Arachis hypogaea]
MADMSRGKFARLCVEVDLTKPLLGRYLINGREYHIEYEGIHHICFTYGRVDHDQQHYPNNKRKEETTKKQQENQSAEAITGVQQENNSKKQQDMQKEKASTSKNDTGKQVITENNSSFGEWMVVQRLKRGKKGQKEDVIRNREETSRQREVPQIKRNQGRFGVLHIEENPKAQGQGIEEQREQEKDTQGKREKEQQNKSKAKAQLEQKQSKKSSQPAQKVKAKQNNTKNTEKQEQRNQEPEQNQKKTGEQRESTTMQIERVNHNHHEENWMEAKLSTPSFMEEGIEPSNQNQQKEGRSPDLMEADIIEKEDIVMDSLEKEPSMRLIEGVGLHHTRYEYIRGCRHADALICSMLSL